MENLGLRAIDGNSSSGAHLFLTGASGFVGSSVLRHVLEATNWTVTCPVTMRHNGNQGRFRTLLDTPERQERVNLVHCDLSMPFDSSTLKISQPVDYILNIASLAGVEHSIASPRSFVRNNVDLMLNVLNFAREESPRLLLHMDTDEVYGPTPEGYASKEWDAIIPSNPYAASKASQSALATAWWRTYTMPIVITRTMNLIGPGQSGEKFVPTVIRHVMNGTELPVYSSSDGVPGSRYWIDVDEFARAWLYVVNHTELQMYPEYDRPSMWHIVGEERSNLDVAKVIAELIGKPLKYNLVDFHTSRPGHDLRYALDGTKLENHGWSPSKPLSKTLENLVKFYLDNPEYYELPKEYQ